MSEQLKDGIDTAEEHKGRVRVLTALGYKDGMIYVRRVGKDMFLWDAIWEGQLYSSYIIVTQQEHEVLSEEQVHEIADMCFAGGAATIDTLRGDELSEKEKGIVKTFEANREVVENQDDAPQNNLEG